VNQPDTITVRNWAIAITIGIALVVLFIILSLLKNYLWPEVYEAPEFRYERIKPVGQVNVGPIEVVAQTASAPKSGKEIFETVCTACHSTGVLGAPKYGDKASWEPRIAKGEAVLIQSALNGFNKMPARGGQPKLSDEEIKATVQYMLEAVGASSNSDTKATSSSGTTGESSPPPRSEPEGKANPTEGTTGESSPPPKPEPEGKTNPTEGTTSESSPPPKPESEGKANPTEGTTGESSPPPKSEPEGKANPTENNSALPNTSSLASSSGAPKSTAQRMRFTQPQSSDSNSINKHLPISARGQNNKVDLAPAGNNTHTKSKVTEPQGLTREISSQKKT